MTRDDVIGLLLFTPILAVIWAACSFFIYLIVMEVLA